MSNATDPNAVQPLVFTTLEDGLLELNLPSGKIVVLKKLDGFEQLAADDFCGESMHPMRVSRTYGICLLRRVNGIEVSPLANMLEFHNVARSLTANDTLILARAYNQLETPEGGLALKNESSAVGG